MLTSEEVIKVLRSRYPYLASEFGVKRIGLFGSYAKGTPTVHSDIDLVIEFDRPVGFKFMDLGEYLEDLLGSDVDIITRAGIESIRVRQVAEDIEGSIVYVAGV